MKNQKLLEGKIWNALTALTSGILTNIFYDAISNTSYILQVTKTQTKIIPCSESILKTCAIIFLIFIVTWCFISILIPIIFNIIKRFRFKKIIRYSKSELISNFEICKKDLSYLESVFLSNTTNDLKSDLIKLNIKKLAIIVNNLHRIFLPSNTHLKQHIKSYFRKPDHTSIITIENQLSGYEILSLISLTEKMVNVAKDYSDNISLLKKDCYEMQIMINELKEEYSNI